MIFSILKALKIVYIAAESRLLVLSDFSKLLTLYGFENASHIIEGGITGPGLPFASDLKKLAIFYMYKATLCI